MHARLFYKQEQGKMEDLTQNQLTFREQPFIGVSVISGPDRKNFLQRQSTNDVRQVTGDRMLTTVITSPIGRILDVLYLFENEDQGEPVIYAISQPGRAPAVLAYLKSRIFFMDQVKIRDASSDYVHFNLIGQDVEKILPNLDFTAFPDAGQMTQTQFQANSLRVFRHNPHLGLGFQLIALYEMRDQIRRKLEELGLRELMSDEYEIMRVEAGILAVDREISEEHTPLEVKLESTISDNKGCYTGQEVIARQMNYDKVTRKLVGLFLERNVTAGDSLRLEGKPVGKITSSVDSPRFGPIALAVVKRPHTEGGTELTVHDREGVLAAKVTSLPFLRQVAE